MNTTAPRPPVVLPVEERILLSAVPRNAEGKIEWSPIFKAHDRLCELDKIYDDEYANSVPPEELQAEYRKLQEDILFQPSASYGDISTKLAVMRVYADVDGDDFFEILEDDFERLCCEIHRLLKATPKQSGNMNQFENMSIDELLEYKRDIEFAMDVRQKLEDEVLLKRLTDTEIQEIVAQLQAERGRRKLPADTTIRN